MHVGARRRFVRMLAVVVLLGAVLPSVAYLGHWAPRWLPAEALERAVPDHDHSSHTYGAFVSSVAPWWVGQEMAVSLEAGQERAGMSLQDPLWTEPSLPPQSPPPRHV